MKKHHVTFLLLTLFFTGLILLWWADYAEVPTARDAEALRNLVLPELRKIPATEIRRIEVVQTQADVQGAHPPNRLVFERRPEGWQMIEPSNAAADPSRLDTLVQNLKNLMKSPEAGTIEESPANFGLEPPVASIRAFGNDGKQPLAALEIGKSVRDRLYVRPAGKAGIEVVDARLFKGIGEPAPDWRERSIFNLASFQIGRLGVSGPGRALNAERREGRWRLVRPIAALADDSRIEEVLGELTSLRVLDGALGFVADDVKDLAKYGLDKDQAMRIEVTPNLNGSEPQVLLIGKAAGGDDGRMYAMRSDQDDVVLINGKALRELGVDPNALRSKKVADFNPAIASFVRIEAQGKTFDLSRFGGGWTLLRPVREQADQELASNLLSKLAGLETSEFLAPDKVRSTQLDKPFLTLKLWQLRPGERFASQADVEPKGAPQVDLHLGRHDVLKRTVFARMEGDPTVLTLPDGILDALPENPLAFRERALLHVSPGQVSRLAIEQGNQKVVVSHPKTGAPNQWRLEEPIEAPADDEAVTKALVVLTNFHALRLITDEPGQERSHGLDAPTLRVSWTVPAESGGVANGADATTTLMLGTRVPKSEAWYARLSTSPLIFTLSDALVLPFRAEFRNRRVVAFSLKQLERLTVRWPGRSLTFKHHPTPRGGVSDWDPESASLAPGFDLPRIHSLATDFARLQTRRFVQHAGLFPAECGLDKPQLQVEAFLNGKPDPIVLRVGQAIGGGEFYATTDPGGRGTVFILAGPAWSALVLPQSTQPSGELPSDVFAPPPANASKGP